MKKLIPFLCLSFLLHIGWTSETGGGVVSEQSNIVETSIEATTVLQSDTLTLLYGGTRLGGVTNYASFDTGGVLTLRNVASSNNKILLNAGDAISWLSGIEVPSVQYSTADVLELTRANVTGIISADGVSATSIDVTTLTGISNLSLSGEFSASTVHVSGALAVSGNSTFVGISTENMTATGSTITNGDITTARITTGNVTTGNVTTLNATDSFLTEAVLGNTRHVLDNGKLYYEGNRPKRTIYLTGAGATAITAVQSTDTVGAGGDSPLFKITGMKMSGETVQTAQWNFVVPDSYVGTSVDASVVWLVTSLDTGSVSFDAMTTGLANEGSFASATWSQTGSVSDAFVASGASMTTSAFSLPTSWVSGSNAVVQLRRQPQNAADTMSNAVNVVGMRLEYEVQTESD